MLFRSLSDPQDIVKLTKKTVSGIHVKGGTILETENKGDPFNFPIQNKKGKWKFVDRSDELVERIKELGIEAVINIGGDGSQRISQKLYEKGLNIIGVPKTIDNDLSGTDYTFGFQTAVEIATEAVDKLVSTAQSHNRVMIAEVMGRDAGWICLHTAVAAGADVALIPEIPYDIDKVVKKLKKRIKNKRGFANIVIAEGAKPKYGKTVSKKSKEVGYTNPMLGGIGHAFLAELQQKMDVSARVTILGHIQRGGIPNSFDRVLASQFGVKAFELMQTQDYGRMVSYQLFKLTSVPISEVIEANKYINKTDYLIHTARRLGISLGD